MHQLASPARFQRLSRPLIPWLAAAAALLLGMGFYCALLHSPPDYQQGEAVRIMYVHVPSAYLAVTIYAVIGFASAAFLVWRHPLADVIAVASAPVGAAFTFITLATGALWGKPMWGAWWAWDARLTSVLIMLFLYLGYMALAENTEESESGKKALAIYALIGCVNLPVIKFSVEWWNTLHQPASLIRMGGPSIAPEMLTPLLLLMGGFTAFYLWLLGVRVNTRLLAMKNRRARRARMGLQPGAR